MSEPGFIEVRVHISNSTMDPGSENKISYRTPFDPDLDDSVIIGNALAAAVQRLRLPREAETLAIMVVHALEGEEQGMFPELVDGMYQACDKVRDAFSENDRKLQVAVERNAVDRSVDDVKERYVLEFADPQENEIEALVSNFDWYNVEQSFTRTEWMSIAHMAIGKAHCIDGGRYSMGDNDDEDLPAWSEELRGIADIILNRFLF